MGPEFDRDLLRRFEPVAHFAEGERFFPADAGEYVDGCGLWARRAGEGPRCLVPAGELSLDTLGRAPTGPADAVHYLLRGPIGDESGTAGVERAGGRAGRGRHARVAYHARMVDALYTLTLLARSRVPGVAAADAARAYRDTLARAERYQYYGRVVRHEWWTVLQYWFFYHFDNWRSGFRGANDHDADWEMVTVYLDERSDGDLRPEWVAYSCHNQPGEEVRRRWDDPELTKTGDHPVVYVGAGSHAGYCAAGEYLTEIELPLFATASRAAQAVRRFWHRRLRQYGKTADASDGSSNARLLTIPFVDYAGGGGPVVGPGQALAWAEPALLDPVPDWVSGYRGLWGLYARDPFAAEDAPAGPMFNRDGTPRRSWFDPVGWAGLDRVLPASRQLDAVVARRAAVFERRSAIEAELREQTQRLEASAAEVAALGREPRLGWLRREREMSARTSAREAGRLRARLADDDVLVGALDRGIERLRAGERETYESTLMRRPRGSRQSRGRLAAMAEVWAAASVGLVLIGVAGLLLLARGQAGSELAAFVAAFVLIETGLRSGLSRLVAIAAIVLVTAAVAIVVYEFVWLVILLGVLAVGGYVLWENLREIWS